MKNIFATTTALACLAFANTLETVLVKGGKDGPVRVNKDDFDADQAKDKDDRQYEAHTGKEESETGETGARAGRSDVNLTNAGGVQTTAAPSAPDFTGDKGSAPNIDPVKGAAAPVTTTVDQLLVLKDGKKFFISDGMGVKIAGDRAKLLDIDENGYDTEKAAKAVQTRTEPKPTPA